MTPKKKTAKLTVKKARPIITLVDGDWEVQFRVSEWKKNQYLESRYKIQLHVNATSLTENEYERWGQSRFSFFVYFAFLASSAIFIRGGSIL